MAGIWNAAHAAAPLVAAWDMGQPSGDNAIDWEADAVRYYLQKAITARCASSSGSALRTLLSETSSKPKFFAGQAPDGVVLPYVTFHDVASSVTGSMDEDLDEPMVQFSTWVADYSEAAGLLIAEAIITLYADALLAFDSGKGGCLSARRMTSPRSGKDPNGGYHIMVDFHFMHDNS